MLVTAPRVVILGWELLETVPAEVAVLTVPVTSPVRFPTNPLLAVMVVPVTAAGVVPPMIPFRVPVTLPSMLALRMAFVPVKTLLVSVAVLAL